MPLQTVSVEDLAALLDALAATMPTALAPAADDPDRYKKLVAIALAQSAVQRQAAWCRRFTQPGAMAPWTFQAHRPQGAELS